jgi:Protein of unknown function (DUF3095)
LQKGFNIFTAGMAEVSNDMFYTRLPVNEIPLGELLTEPHLFYRVPADWEVVITDVRNSTLAAQQGMHQTVNLVATGSIVAVLNIAEKANLSVPFFFGGDGATFIIPPSILTTTIQALLLHRQNTAQTFNMELRVGHIPVKEIYQDGHELNITKFKASELFSIPVLLGGGLAYAEKIIKSDTYTAASFGSSNDELDLAGMQCRWDMIKPPQHNQEVVSLLVIATNEAKQPAVFKKVIEQLDKIYGAATMRQPISVARLQLKTTFARIGQEMRSRFGGIRPVYLVRTWAASLLGKLYFRTRQGKKYLYSLVSMTDTLVIDGKINTVISGTAAQREQLETALNQLEKEGEILYGLCVSAESVMSCYVRNMNDKHIHFVDGAGGGYTKAAGVLKKKISS